MSAFNAAEHRAELQRMRDDRAELVARYEQWLDDVDAQPDEMTLTRAKVAELQAEIDRLDKTLGGDQ